MRMWMDAEFNEYRGQTISLGIVADDGKEFYEVLRMYEPPTDWIANNVLPVLNREPINRKLFQEKLAVWLNQFSSLQIFVDHIADAHRFLRLLETDEEGGWYELPNLMIAVVTKLKEKQRHHSVVEHNALSDARALRDRYKLEHSNGQENSTR